MTGPPITVFHIQQNDLWGANVIPPGATVGEARYDFASEAEAYDWALDVYGVLSAQKRAKVTPLG